MLALSSSGVTAWTFWARYPVVLTMFSMVSSIVAWLHAVFFTSEKLTKIAGLVGTWKQIEIEYELLWAYDPDLATPETWKRFEEASKFQGKVDETGLRVSEKLREKAFQQMMLKRGLSNGAK
jgi:hypothetical protein